MKMIRLTFFNIIALVWILTTDQVQAAIVLPQLVGDNMIIQRDIKVPIWGWAAAGEKISVNFKNESYRAVAGADGKWAVTLKESLHGGPYQMTIEGAAEVLKIKNILIGDVWICSGQSNMAFNFNALKTLYPDDAAIRNSYDQEIAAAANDNIRQIIVNRNYSAAPQSTVKMTGWKIAGPNTIMSFSSVAYFFAKHLYEKYNVPIGLINASYGGTPAEAWMSADALKKFPQFSKTIRFLKDTAALTSKVNLYNAVLPTVLFNAMINPIISYGIKGVLWYQGENNQLRGYEYRDLFPALINDWRSRWGQGNFPFIYQQLVNFKEASKVPVEAYWAELREAQLMTLSKQGNTAMAVGIDLGIANNIHPPNKKDVGERLAMAAMKVAYKETDLVTSGPLYQSMRVDNDKIIISFSNIGQGLAAKGGAALKYFSIAGADKKFVWASAVIKGNQVIVSSEQIPDPVAVRYAWANNPEGCNLTNIEGLPASPFRTDNWPGLSAKTVYVNNDIP